MRTCHDGCLGPVDFTGYCEKHGAPIQTDAESEELAELRKDKARLDWIESSGSYETSKPFAWAFPVSDPNDGTWWIYGDDGSEDGTVVDVTADSLRDVIDAAMEATP